MVVYNISRKIRLAMCKKKMYPPIKDIIKCYGKFENRSFMGIIKTPASYNNQDADRKEQLIKGHLKNQIKSRTIFNHKLCNNKWMIKR